MSIRTDGMNEESELVMFQNLVAKDVDPTETTEWLESIQAVLMGQGSTRAQFLLGRLIEWGKREGVVLPFTANTPYVNTIPLARQLDYPGDRAIERRIKSLVRWNAMAMVVRANRAQEGIGGHISTYASAATLYQVGFNHFFRGHDGGVGDQIYFQGHAAPGIYAQAFVERRIDRTMLSNFRCESGEGGSLSSYPHPWLMRDFWEFPTVSMGLGPLSSIYQARFNRYLHDRGLKDTSGSHVWAFIGDGETDEPETKGAISLASREALDNLVWVINCNLQRLDGPVRGNGQIIQELEATFRGAGWNVIKVLWGSEWDPLLEADHDGLLPQRMLETVDGQYQKYSVEPGAYTREHFFGTDPRLAKLIEHLTDDQIIRLKRGGHDPLKVYSAYKSAVDHTGSPTVILAKTVKGYGLGEAGEGRNVTHQQKKLNEEELKSFRDRFDIPLTDAQLADMPFYRPDEGSVEHEYLVERRKGLGGYVPRRVIRSASIKAPKLEYFKEFLTGSSGRDVATTMGLVRIMTKLMDHPELGKLVVPIVPDEARTFGMDALFRKYGIYAHSGQLYDPVDSHLLLNYKEAKDGQLLEEGITEAGSMASFTAAGTAHTTHGVETIPFYTFYSMFGFQRIGDSIWAHADARGRGFLIGATAGRTTLAGEGLQHQDGHSHVLASTVPTIQPYDPAFAYELAVLVQVGIHRMYELRDPVFYYITVQNEPYPQPPMPEGVEENIIKGLYKFRPADAPGDRTRVHLFGSGSIIREVLSAQEILAGEYDIAADVWSATSYTLLRRDALEAERWSRLHPDETPQIPYITRMLDQEPWPVVAASDYMKSVPDMIARWIPAGLTALGTDGFGRSDSRKALREFFEVNAAHIVYATLHRLSTEGKYDASKLPEVMRRLNIDPEKVDPATA